MTETMPDTQKKAICELLVYLKKNYYPNANIVGHKEIGDSNCPGINYPLEDIKKNYEKYAESEELSMAQYEELKKMIEDRDKRIDVLEEKINAPEMVYNYIDNNMPQWAREPVQWCVDKGIIAGTDKGLNLNDTKLWTCVVLYRAVKFVGKLIGVKI